MSKNQLTVMIGGIFDDLDLIKSQVWAISFLAQEVSGDRDLINGLLDVHQRLDGICEQVDRAIAQDRANCEVQLSSHESAIVIAEQSYVAPPSE
jgi:hypothetical protein